MAKKSKNKELVPHQELSEFLTLMFNDELNTPREYHYDFDQYPSLYLSLKSRNFTSANERDEYVTQLHRLFVNTTQHLGYELRGLHVCVNDSKKIFRYLHSSYIKEGIESFFPFEYSQVFEMCNYFQHEFPPDRMSEVLAGSNRKMIDTFDDIFAEKGKIVLYIPLSSVYGMIFSK